MVNKLVSCFTDKYSQFYFQSFLTFSDNTFKFYFTKVKGEVLDSNEFLLIRIFTVRHLKKAQGLKFFSNGMKEEDYFLVTKLTSEGGGICL